MLAEELGMKTAPALVKHHHFDHPWSVLIEKYPNMRAAHLKNVRSHEMKNRIKKDSAGRFRDDMETLFHKGLVHTLIPDLEVSPVLGDQQLGTLTVIGWEFVQPTVSDYEMEAFQIAARNLQKLMTTAD